MFAAAGLMLATPSCKKGENDPFMSLSSRKSRVAGDWTVSGYTSNWTSTDSDGDSWTDTDVLDGNIITTTSSSTVDGITTSSTSTTTINEATFTFGKDGTYTQVMNTTTVSTSVPLTGFTNTNTEVETMTTTGNWSFAGKVKDSYKNKERIILNVLTASGSDQETDVLSDDSGLIPSVTTVGATSAWTSNFYSGEISTTYEIDQLKGKEMIFKQMTANSGTSSWTPDGGPTTTSTDNVVTGDATWTLTAQ